MGSPQRESFDVSKRYKGIYWIKARDAQDWSLIEEQLIQDLERKRFGDRVFKEGAIIDGLAVAFPATGQIGLSLGQVWTQGRAEPVDAATLTYGTGVTTAQVTTASTAVLIGVNPTTLGFPVAGTAYLGAGSGALDAFAYTGVDALGFIGVTGIGQTWASGTKVVKIPVDTVWTRWVLDQITRTEDPSLKAPATGEDVEERVRTTLTLQTTNPDALDEPFETFDGTLPRNWTLASGATAKGYPAKFGETGIQLIHTTGTATEIRRSITLTPNTEYTVYFHARTAEGHVDLAIANGAFLDLQRDSPAWNPTDFGFATSPLYGRKSFTFTSDGNVEDATIRIVIPASAPSTQILIDGLLVTLSSAPLTSLTFDRHHAALLFWNRADDTVTRAVPRASNLRMADLEPPLSGADIVDIDQNPGLQDLLAEGTFDEHGHYRVPPGLTVERDTTLDTASVLGLRIAAGRAYVLGYLVKKGISTALTIAKATTTARITAEAKSFTFGTNLYQVNKNAGLDAFPIEEIVALTAQVVEVLGITRGGVAGGTDALGVTNVTAILSASGGTAGGSTAGTLTGSATGPFVFTEANNVLRLKVSKYDGTAGTFQVFTFARGSYTLAEVIQALSTGSGRAYRSGRPFDAGHDNVIFENDGANHLRIKTKTKSASSSVETDSEGNGSTCNTLLGFASGGATGTGTGTHWTATTHFLQSGNSIDWSPGADTPGTDEPDSGQSYTVVIRRNKTLVLNTDYKLGGLFGSLQTYHYKVATWGATGEGIVGTAVSRATPAGSINRLSWAAVPNAISYHVYRSTDGATYHFLKNTTDTFFIDDGSMTPDSGKTPNTVQTQLNGALTGGETTVTVDSTTGFPTSGTAFVEGSDIFTYTGVTGTTFTGVPGSGGNAVVAHPDNATVRMGPDIGPLTLAEDVLGVVNFNPQGQDPEHAQSFATDYDYYQPRIDRIVVDRFGVISAIAGVPADQPLPASMPATLMELAQVKAAANSTSTTIQNLKVLDRPTVADLKFLMEKVEELKVNDLSQEILNQIDTKTTAAKKGLFADGMGAVTQHDANHVLYDAFLNIPLRHTTVPHDGELKTISEGGLSVNGGATTVALVNDTGYLLTSSEITLIEQTQWSEEMLVNPYQSFTPPPAAIRLFPDRNVWTLPHNPALVWSHPENMRQRERLLQALREARIATLPVPLRPGETIEGVIEGEQRYVLENRAFYRVQPMVVRVIGWNFLGLEDNITCTFGGIARDLTPVAPTVPGTNPNTVKADANGRFIATFLTPSLLTPGIYDVVLKGPISTATRSFTALVRILPPPPPPPPQHTDPLAQSFSFPIVRTVSAFGLYFTAKDATKTLTVQVRTMVAGFPGQEVIVEKTLAPSEITLNAETKVDIPWFRLPANTSVALCLLTESPIYKVQTATLGRSGRAPAAWITAQPYEPGVLFSSANAESWTVHQATDLRFKVYGRSFSTSEQILQLSSVTPGLTPANYSDLWLAADQDVPEGTTLNWEYELSGDGVPRPFGVFEKRLLDSLASSVIVRARFKSNNPDVSPVVGRYTIGLAGFLNKLTGVYVTRGVSFAQNLSTGHIYVTQALPNGTSVIWYLSNDDGTTWKAMQQLGGAIALDSEWSEYTYELTAPGTFSPTDKRFRAKCEFTAASRLVIPKIARVGVTLE
jgi:hypothetical protein